VRYKHLPIASLLIGAAQEDDLVSPGFEQLTAISNHSTLDFTLITTSNGSSFLATHRGNGYALLACHQMMMMISVAIQRFNAALLRGAVYMIVFCRPTTRISVYSRLQYSLFCFPSWAIYLPRLT